MKQSLCALILLISTSAAFATENPSPIVKMARARVTIIKSELIKDGDRIRGESKEICSKETDLAVQDIRGISGELQGKEVTCMTEWNKQPVEATVTLLALIHNETKNGTTTELLSLESNLLLKNTDNSPMDIPTAPHNTTKTRDLNTKSLIATLRPYQSVNCKGKECKITNPFIIEATFEYIGP